MVAIETQHWIKVLILIIIVFVNAMTRKCYYYIIRLTFYVARFVLSNSSVFSKAVFFSVCVSLLFPFRFQSMFESYCNHVESWSMPCIMCMVGCIFLGFYWTCLPARHLFDEMLELFRNELVCDILALEFVMLHLLAFLFASEVI